MKRLLRLTGLILLGLGLAACGGKAEPTPTKTPRPTATATPLPTIAVAFPAVEAHQPSLATPPPGLAEPNSPLAPPTDTPVPQPTPTPEPGIEALPPVPVLAADLDCAAGCEADTPNAEGLALVNRESGQLNIWARNLPRLGEEEEYVGWLQDGALVRSANSFDAWEDGTASDFVVLLGEEKERRWSDYFVTIEPAESIQGPSEDDVPTGPRSISGPLRETVMGEALYNRYDMPCRQCHGPDAAGGEAAGTPGGLPSQVSLRAPALIFDDFLLTVREKHDQPIGVDVAADRDLRHIYAWLMSFPP